MNFCLRLNVHYNLILVVVSITWLCVSVSDWVVNKVEGAKWLLGWGPLATLVKEVETRGSIVISRVLIWNVRGVGVEGTEVKGCKNHVIYAYCGLHYLRFVLAR